MKKERDFKGIWIPKEVWLDKSLTIMEKVFLVEIDSLDNEKGCFAGNGYFTDFFGLKVTRVSQIINSLIKKDYISSNYIRKGEQIVRRVLTVKRKKLLHKSVTPLTQKCNTPTAKAKEPLTQKCKDNNTVNNPSNNTINKNTSLEKFEELYKNYPRKDGKKVAFRHFNASVKDEADYINITRALSNYKDYLVVNKTEMKYTKTAKVWFNNWRDWIDAAIVLSSPPDTKKELGINNFEEMVIGEEDNNFEDKT